MIYKKYTIVDNNYQSKYNYYDGYNIDYSIYYFHIKMCYLIHFSAQYIPKRVAKMQITTDAAI